MTPANLHAAIITGAGTGIGFATARRLGAKGWAVALAGRRREQLEHAAAALREAGSAPERVVVHPCDVADAASVRSLVADAHRRFGRVDALVNNAGVAALVPIDKGGPDFLRDVFAVNALGPAYAIAAVWPIMRAQGGGVIVNVSTIGTLDPFPGFFAYAGAKSAVNSFARSCAKEGAALGIRAFAVAPGATDTPMLRSMFDETALPPSHCLHAEDVAAVIVECVEGGRDAENGGTIYLTPHGA